MSANQREAIAALSFRQQADIATMPADAANYWNLAKSNDALAVVDPKTEDDALDLGKGDEFANNVYPLAVDTNVPFEKYATSEAFAFCGVFGLGSFVKDSPATGAKRYTCTPLDPVASGIELPFITYLEAMRQGGSAIYDQALVGMVMSSFGFELNSGAGRQNAKVTFSLVGSGEVVTPSGVVIPSAFVEHPLNAGSMTLTLIGDDYVSLRDFIKLKWEWNNNIRADQGLFPGSGVDSDGFQKRGRLENGDRTYTMTATVRLRTASPEFARLKAQTEGTAVIGLQGALITGSTYHGMELTHPRVRISSAVRSSDNGIAAVDLTIRPLKDPSDGLVTLVAVTGQDNIGGAAV